MRLLLLFTLAVGCASNDPYIDDLGMDELSTGKADGLLDSAEVLSFNEVGDGYVEGEQMDVFAIDLKHGQKISLTQKRTSGDLAPHFTLYRGGTQHISSATFSRTTTRITKTYVVPATGRYYIAVKPYQGDGEGRYTLVATCSADCNGTALPPEPLDAEGAGDCIAKARVCSFARLPSFNGAVGAARARSIFDDCLGEDARCEDACTHDEGAHFVCDDIVESLPFYADQSAACYGVVESCLEQCFDIDNGSPDEVGYTDIGVCWNVGFNGTCDSYARGHVKCGGTYADGSDEECHALCESTIGAWTDDLDTICEESCP